MYRTTEYYKASTSRKWQETKARKVQSPRQNLSKVL